MAYLTANDPQLGIPHPPSIPRYPPRFTVVPPVTLGKDEVLKARKQNFGEVDEIVDQWRDLWQDWNATWMIYGNKNGINHMFTSFDVFQFNGIIS